MGDSRIGVLPQHHDTDALGFDPLERPTDMRARRRSGKGNVPAAGPSGSAFRDFERLWDETKVRLLAILEERRPAGVWRQVCAPVGEAPQHVRAQRRPAGRVGRGVEHAPVDRLPGAPGRPLAAGHRTLAPQLVDALKAKGAEDVIVVVGGVIPRQDYDFLMENGVSAVFGPGTNVMDAARSVLDLIEGRLRNS